jgi:hypothetical protein
MLLAAGANKEAKAAQGKTPAQLASSATARALLS